MMTPQRGFTRRGDGWWSERSRGSSSDAASVLAGRRRPETGWLWYSLLAPISCSIWRFSDRVLISSADDMPLLLLSCAFSEVQDAKLPTQDSSPWRKEYHLTPTAPPGAWVFTNSTNCGDRSPYTFIL